MMEWNGIQRHTSHFSCEITIDLARPCYETSTYCGIFGLRSQAFLTKKATTTTCTMTCLMLQYRISNFTLERTSFHIEVVSLVPRTYQEKTYNIPKPTWTAKPLCFIAATSPLSTIDYCQSSTNKTYWDISRYIYLYIILIFIYIYIYIWNLFRSI